MRNKGVTILKIEENVYALESTKGSYAYLVKDEETILIDTGLPGKGKSILEEIKSLDVKSEDIEHILLTHHDVDHIGNAAFLQEETGAILWASQEDLPYILGDKGRPGVKKLVSFIMRVKKPENIQTYNNEKIGDVKVIRTPGHTPGHVCLLFKDVLFAGDLVRNSKGQLKPSSPIMTWDNTVLRESITKLDEYSFNWVCPAHGEPLEVTDEWKQLIK